jgi:hypothetical protein
MHTECASSICRHSRLKGIVKLISNGNCGRSEVILESFQPFCVSILGEEFMRTGVALIRAL